MESETKKTKLNKKLGIGAAVLATVLIAVLASTQYSFNSQNNDVATQPAGNIPKPPPEIIEKISNKTASFAEAKTKVELANAIAPSYVPANLILDNVRSIEDPSGNEILLIYSPLTATITNDTTVQQAIDNGILVSIKKEKNTNFDWNAFVKQQVEEAPYVRSSTIVNGNQILLIKSNPVYGIPYQAKSIIGNLQIEIASTNFDTATLSKVMSSMILS